MLEEQLAVWVGSVIRVEMVKEWKGIEFKGVERGVLRVDVHMKMWPPAPPLGRQGNRGRIDQGEHRTRMGCGGCGENIRLVIRRIFYGVGHREIFVVDVMIGKGVIIRWWRWRRRKRRGRTGNIWWIHGFVFARSNERWMIGWIWHRIRDSDGRWIIRLIDEVVR